MNITEKQQKKAAKEFAEYWKDKGYEKGQSQTFWIELLQKVFGVEDATHFISFEDQVHIDKSTGFIDGYIESTKVMIEQKSLGKPFSHAGVIRFNGQLMTYVPECGPCYRCIFKEPPPDNEVLKCSQAGVIGAMCGVIGSLQAMEDVK